MKAMSLKVWSSVVNMITLGLLLAARELSPRTRNASSVRQAIPAISNPALAILLKGIKRT